MEPEIAFEIVSNDKGFNGLIKHVKSLGRSCKKVTTKNTKPKMPKQKAQTSPAETFSTLIKHLKKIEDRSRPASKEKLLKWIESHSPDQKNGVKPEKIYERLEKAKKIEVSEDRINYRI